MSSHKLVLIRNTSRECEAPPQDWFHLDSNCKCRTLTWDAWNPEIPSQLRADLIVPITSSETSGAKKLFDWLAAHPVGTPVLAVFLDTVPDTTLRLALDVTDDFLFWPVARQELKLRLRRILGAQWDEVERARSALMRDVCAQQLVGRHPAFVRIVDSLPRMARIDLPVLITGETGTGKELVARAIHSLSDRHRASFIPVDCPSLPDSLFENEVFGHVRGAYTDARGNQKGLVALAESGTLFLDEVDALPQVNQAKLLRFLQDKTYRRLGGERFRGADVRVMAASNSDLDRLVARHEFRADLFYRLSVLRVYLPPLRFRKTDIPALVNHCLDLYSPEASQGAITFSRPALRKLMTHSWPGNVRELFNVVQRACVSSHGKKIQPCDIDWVQGGLEQSGPCQSVDESFAEAKARTIETFERSYVERMLRRHQGNVTRAARAARKERRAFGRLVKKYAINPKQFSG